MMFKILILFLIVTLSSCATGVSTYEYEHRGDGSTWVKVKSANEIGAMEMGIDRETGTLEVKIGDMSKKSDTVEVVDSIENIVHDMANPLPTGG